MAARGKDSASAPRPEVHIEVMTEARFAGAAATQNEFLGARKALCGILSYRCCPSSALRFGEQCID